MARPSKRATPSVPGAHSGKVRRQVMFRSSSSMGPASTPLWKPCGRRLAAGWRGGQARGRLNFSHRRGEPFMQQPERWPLSPADSWLAWREHLNRFEGLHAETLKREAEAEMARILRCQAERPRRPSLVPERVGSGGGG